MLAHRRLAIIDLDSRADQPMHSSTGRYTIVFNGEIYNYVELRDALVAQGVELRTQSDTEVLLALFALDGPAMLPRLRGMFSLAIWDSETQRLFVARDPYGIKPLYLASTPAGTLVASSVKALVASGLVDTEPDPVGWASFWLTGSIAEPHTGYRGIRAFPPGHHAWVAAGGTATPVRWLDVAEQLARAEGPSERGVGDLQETVREAVRSSVRAHQVADVPVGVFLSGGIDSTALAALMAEDGREVTGVTLRFEEYAGTAQDEGGVAAQVASAYGLKHVVRTVTRAEFDAELDTIFDQMDQPSVDGVNTYFASKAVAEAGLKVAVSGVGGDELFQGYDHFRQLPRMVRASRAAEWLPGWTRLARGAARASARRTGDQRWSELAEVSSDLTGAYLVKRSLFSVADLPGLMGGDLADEVRTAGGLRRHVTQPPQVLPTDLRLAVSALESTLYLRNQLLRDSDWASMAHSIELRTPLVDWWLLAELAPHASQFESFPGKTLLARSPARPLPAAVVDRPKTGFNIPVARWRADVTGGGEQDLRAWARHVAERYRSERLDRSHS